MRTKLAIVVVVLAMVMPFVIPYPVAGMTGAGTLGEPYIISDVDDLQDMDLSLAAYYELGGDIDASATSTWNWDGGRGRYAGFEPVGTSGGTAFTGYFDGKGYTISGLYIDYQADHAGLFGYDTGGAASAPYPYIKNVILEDSYVRGGDNPYAVGTLIGRRDGGTNSRDITNVHVVNGEVVGRDDADNYEWRIGGLIGMVYADTVIEGCSFQGTVVGVSTLGGLIASLTPGDTGTVYLSNSYASADVESNGGLGTTVGVLIGFSQDCVVEQCFSVGYAYGDKYVGGLVGRADIASEYYNCFSRADVTSTGTDVDDYCGGFSSRAASAAVIIDDCYSTGYVVSSSAGAGGFLGWKHASATVTNCFWDTQTSVMPTSAAGTGKSTVQMRSKTTFTDAGWDFDTIWDIGGYVNDGYPYFLWWYEPAEFPPLEVDQVQWFEPITIISGTTLPDRTSTQNGVITWGANPGGIAIVMGELVSDAAVPSASSPVSPTTSIPDMTGESGQPGWTAAQPTLPDNPIYPLVSMMSDNTNIPIWLWWVIMAVLILFIIMMVSFRYAPHQLITAIAGGGWCGFMYHVGIFPFWVMFIFAAMAAAIIIGERTPTVS